MNIIIARDAVNNFLDSEKNRNKYLSPTEMNCLGKLYYVMYCYHNIIMLHLNRESFAQVLVQVSNREPERGCADHSC